ncbi:MAG: threonine/serine dehydratase [Acidobacteriota bacterium]|nr:threonine/serine dehydratase [Acidobacteriota bacterium]
MLSPHLIPEADYIIKDIKDGVITTPMRFSAALSELLGCNLYLKCEHLQRTGSFKFRGALNKLALWKNRIPGITAASTGNHGMGVARAAQIMGIEARIFVPANASLAKLNHILRMGATLEKVDGDCLAAELEARRVAAETGAEFVSPYNDPQVIAGQGTIGLEIYEQLQDVEVVYVSVGGGGLIGGIGTWLKHLRPDTQIVGCWAAASPVMYRCMDAGRIVEVAERETISDATAGNLEEGSITLKICKHLIDRRILVSEEEIHKAMKALAEHERWMLEGAAGVAMAACMKDAENIRDKKVAVVLCGRNITLEKFRAAVA